MRISILAVLFRVVMVIVLTQVVGGCVTMTTAPDPLKAAPRADASTVVVSVTSNSAEIKGFDGLVVRRVSAPGVNVVDLNALNQIVPGLARDTSVFVGLLPEGEYEFAEFTDMKSNRKLPMGAGGRELLGRFKVTRGKPVDLGRLVLTPANHKVIVGRSAKVQSNKPLLQKFAPEYAALLNGETGDGWVTPRSDADTIEQYALSRPVGFDNPVELEDGAVLAASRLGSVLVRSSAGKWSVIRSAGIESLLCAMPVKLPNATLLAVGEFNTLLRLPPEGKNLVAMNTGNLPPGNLLFIAGDDAAGWYVAQQRDSEVIIYRSAKLEMGNWQALAKEEVGRSFWNGNNQLWFWRRPQGFSYAASAGTINHIDFSSGALRTIKVPKDSRLIDVVAGPDGSIGILTSPGGGFGGVFADMYLSRDEGTTWREIASKNKIKSSAPIPVTPTTILASSIASAFNPRIELNASHDDGVSWEELAGNRAGEKLIPLRAGRMLSVQPGAAGVFTVSFSVDEGKSWRLEYSNFDKALYDAQQKKN